MTSGGLIVLAAYLRRFLKLPESPPPPSAVLPPLGTDAELLELADLLVDQLGENIGLVRDVHAFAMAHPLEEFSKRGVSLATDNLYNIQGALRLVCEELRVRMHMEHRQSHSEKRRM